MLAVARRNLVETRSPVRCGLGDLDPEPHSRAHDAADVLIESLGPAASTTMATRIARFAGVSVLLGRITFERFLVAGDRLGPISPTRRGTAIADAAGRVIGLQEIGPPSGRHPADGGRRQHPRHRRRSLRSARTPERHSWTPR